MPPTMGVTTVLRSWLSPLLDLVYPPRCAGCGRPGAWFCPACQAEAAPLPLTRCPACGSPAGERGGPCYRCRHPGSPLNGIFATAIFEPPIRPAIHRFKYGGLSVLAGPLAGRLGDTWLAAGLPGDLIVPVPLHPGREAERGYNQAVLLATALGVRLGLPTTADLLVRARPTASQTTLKIHERHANVAGAFACRGRADGQRVLLVDDVCTTGATMEACAEALRNAGAAAVWGLAVARA